MSDGRSNDGPGRHANPSADDQPGTPNRSGRVRRTRRTVALPLAFVLVFVAAVTSWAFWSATSQLGGNGAAAATTVNQAATPTATPSGSSVVVSWAASSLANGGPAATGYTIRRYSASDVVQTIGAGCAVTITTLTCTENNVPSGQWTYSVVARYADNWSGPESNKSAVVSTDAIAPANSITLSGVTGGAFKTGTTVYYRGNAAGSFRLTNAVIDAGSGPASSTTADLGGTSTGWSHTPSTVTTPAGGPYVSNSFSWVASTTSAPTQVVTGRDLADNSVATTLTLANDSTAPGGSTITYADGVATATPIPITFTTGTDTDGSGIASRQLQRRVAPLSNGVCGTFGRFVDIGPVNPTSAFNDDAVSNAACYQYRYVVTDNVGNVETVAGANTVKTDYAAVVMGTSGLLSHWRLGEAAQSPTSADPFTGSAGTLITSRTGEQSTAWSCADCTTTSVITDQNRTRISGAGYAIYRASQTPPTADYSVSADFHYKGALAGDMLGVVGRLDATAQGGYVARYEMADQSWNIYKLVDNGLNVGPASSFLINQPLTVGENYRVRLEMSGTGGTVTVRLFVNGIQKATWADNSLSRVTQVGRGGIFDGNDTAAGPVAKTNTTGLHLDNFQVTSSTYARAADSKGSNTGDYQNGPNTGVAGALAGDPNTAATFDGINDHVQVVPTTGIPVGATSRSTELWFKTTSATRQALFHYGSLGVNQGFGLGLEANGTQMTGWGWQGGSDVPFTLASDVRDGAWHHVVVTYNGTVLTLHVDGVARGTSAVVRNTVLNMYGFGIGAIIDPKDAVNSGLFFNGSIDEVSLYTRALTQTEISTRFRMGGAAPDFAGPTGGSVTATGLGGAGNAYSTSTTLSLTLSKGADPSGLAASGAQLMRASATYTATGGGSGTCGTFGTYTQVGADDPTSPRSDTVSDEACYRYQYVVADSNGNETKYTSIDIKVDTAPYGAYWAYNEGTGTTAEDSTGNGNTATLQPGAGWTAGKVGSNALSLTGAANSWASTPNPVIDTSESYTVSAWVRLNAFDGYQTFASVEGGVVSPFLLQVTSGNQFRFSQAGSDVTDGGTVKTVTGTTPVTGTWYHVVGVYDKADSRIELYVNGTSQGMTPGAVGWKGTGATTIGRAKFNGAHSDFFNGAIDEVHFYPHVLSATQIAALADDVGGPTGGSVTATGLGGTGSRYSTSTTINLSLAKGTDGSGMATSGNQLRRATGTLSGGTCTAYGPYELVATDPGASFSEVVPDGACYAYRYTVSDTLGHSTVYTSGDVRVDTTAPAAPALAFSAFTNTYWSGSGSTVYYRGAAASGSLTVTATATDNASGIAGYAFPALGTNWSSTAGSAGVNTYSWSGAAASPGTTNITATNNAGLTSGTTPFTLTADDAAPSAGSVNYSSAEQTGTTISVGFTTGTDSGSGIASRLLQRDSAPLTGTTCGTYVGFATIAGGSNPGTSPVADTVTAGRCYKYRYVVTDRLGNQHTATSPNVVKVTVSTCGTQLITNPGFESGNTGWTQSPTGLVTNGAGAVPARTGTYRAWLGGSGVDTDETLSQQVTIPAGCSASLSYWLRATTAETVSPKDYLFVQVTSGATTTTVQSFSESIAVNNFYGQATVDLSAYAGQTVTLRFLSDENAGNQTSFWLDDLSLTTAAGGASTYGATVGATAGLVNWFRLGEAPPPAIAATDSFAGTAGALLTSRAGELGTSWSFYSGLTNLEKISTVGRAYRDGTGYAAYYASGVPNSPTYSVETDLFVRSVLPGDMAGVIGRAIPGSSNFYLARWEQADNSWNILKATNGTLALLPGGKLTGQPALVAGQSYRLKLSMSGTTNTVLSLSVNGATKVTVTDSSTPHTAVGRAGIWDGHVGGTALKSDTAGIHFDNFQVTTASVPVDSKSGNDGQYFGPTLGTTGAIARDANTAVSFDGVDDYVSVNRQIADDFSMEFWFKSTQGLGTGSQWHNGAGMVDGGVSGAANDFGVSLRADGRVMAGTGNPDVTIASTNAGYNDGTWHHVVFTRVRATGALALYVDGEAQGTATGSVASLNSSAVITFGRLQTGSEYYAGSLDEVALYNLPLSAATVAAHYSAGQ